MNKRSGDNDTVKRAILDPDNLDLTLDLFAPPNSSKKKINSKRKGNNYQNLIAKKLNEKFKTTDFCSTPGSGAYATIHKLPEHLKIYGDLITPKNFKFCIEVKHGYSLDITDVFKETSELNNFIRQAKKDAKASNKDWLLIYRKNRQRDLAILHYSHIISALIPKLSFGTYVVVLLDDLLNLDLSYFLDDQ